jgi:hypothetical protein
MKKLALASTLATFPLITFAQVGSFQSMFGNIVNFVDSTLIPFLFGIAFLFFVINVFRYFILGGGNPEAQESAKSLATYGVAAFVFLIIFWGIVNMLVSSLGLDGTRSVTSDYLSKMTSNSNNNNADTGEDTNLWFNDPGDIAAPILDPEDANATTPCISFTTDGVCTDAAEDQTNTGDSLLASRGRIIEGLHAATGDVWQVLNIGTTPNTHFFTMRNTNTGRSVMLTYTAINGDMSNHTDFMIRLEEVRQPGDNNETPIAWVTTRFVYNETNNNMEIFSVSNSSEYSRTYNGTAYMNEQGQFIMDLRDQYGQSYTATQDTWISDFIINGKTEPVR